MNKIYLLVFVSLLLVFHAEAHAKLKVLTTVTDLSALVSEIGGEQVEVSSLAKGTQDPHFIEAKPSYIAKASKADLLVAIGMELEIGYLPPILQGARNPAIMPGANGYLEVGKLVQALELPSGKVTRADGDVHPDGNPHIMLDPIRAGQIAVKIGEKMAELDTANAKEYLTRANAIQKRLQDKTQSWIQRIKLSGVKKVVSYHKTLTYFFDRFGLENPAILEPKPGIPPTAGHILEIIELIRKQQIPLVMIENYFDDTAGNRIHEAVKSVRIVSVPVSVEGAPGIQRLDDLYEKLVNVVEGK